MVPNVHCVKPAAAATINVWSGPMTSNEAKSAAIDAETVAPTPDPGSATRSADAAIAAISIAASSGGCGTASGGSRSDNSAAPARTMAPTYPCPRGDMSPKETGSAVATRFDGEA